MKGGRVWGGRRRAPLEHGVRRGYICSLSNCRGGGCCHLARNHHSADRDRAKSAVAGRLGLTASSPRGL